MAEITIKIQDFDNKIKIVSQPGYAEIANECMFAENGGTPAQGAALFALNELRKEFKRKEPTSIWLPKTKKL